MVRYQDVLRCYDDEAKPFVWLLTLHSSDGKQFKKSMGTILKGLSMAVKETQKYKVYTPKLRVADFERWVEVGDLDK